MAVGFARERQRKPRLTSPPAALRRLRFAHRTTPSRYVLYICNSGAGSGIGEGRGLLRLFFVVYNTGLSLRFDRASSDLARGVGNQLGTTARHHGYGTGESDNNIRSLR